MSKETKTMRHRITLTALLIALFALLPARAGAATIEPFEIVKFDGGAFNSGGAVETQAGSRPFSASTEFDFNFTGTGFARKPFGTLKDVYLDLPPGLVGNPRAVPACPSGGAFVAAIPNGPNFCPPESQVGFVELRGVAANSYYPIYNVEPGPGQAALFKFVPNAVPIQIAGSVLPGDDYRVRTAALNAAETVVILGIKATFWGVPADPAHDEERGLTGNQGYTGSSCADPTIACSNASSAPLKPFLSLPTSCTGPVDTDIEVTTWENEGDEATFTSHDNATPDPNPVGNEGCGAVDFKPTLKARPTTTQADSASGLDVNLHLPQNETCDVGPPVSCGTAEAHLKDSVVTLPVGLSVNPSSANGLNACTEAEVDLKGEDPANCPDASKLGTVEIETPLLDHPIPGSVYLAEPHANPFNSLLALYIAVDDPKSGVVVKLAGKVQSGGGKGADADLAQGQLRATFANNPQLPFEDLDLHFFGGSSGALRTPAVCNTYTTVSDLTPWSSPEGATVTDRDSWEISGAPGGGACARTEAQLASAPSFDAGTIAPIAGGSSPLVVNLRREDGSQQFSSLTLTPPQGLVGKLAGIPYCPDEALAAAAGKSGKAEEASASCPAASYVGSVSAAAGAGPTPYHAPGKAYLMGPYKGAPLSLAIVTPATAGPFDLGTIIVRTALFVDRKTAQITAVSDPIPTMLEGIPLDVRSVQVRIDRPDFTINPTSCDPTSFGGQLMSVLGQTTPLQSRFQVGECGRLGFRPKMTLRLKGGTARAKYPALTAVLIPRPGDANLASISVALPHSEFLAQEHIRTVCTRVQFAADQCPAAAIYGTATVETPLLDYPLTGPVYLRSSDNPLPDLVTDLRGPANQPIKLEAAGRTDSIKGGIRNTFDFVPDAPFTKLTLQMQGGKKGLLVNSRNICKKATRATIHYSAHNGATFTDQPVLKPKCGKAKKGKRPTVQRSTR